MRAVTLRCAPYTGMACYGRNVIYRDAFQEDASGHVLVRHRLHREEVICRDALQVFQDPNKILCSWATGCTASKDLAMAWIT